MLIDTSLDPVRYLKIASMKADQPTGYEEGYKNSMLLQISGGNVYTSIIGMQYVSLRLHRGNVIASKYTIFSSPEVGYVKESGLIEIWMKVVQYNHIVLVSMLNVNSFVTIQANILQNSAPDGYTVIN